MIIEITVAVCTCMRLPGSEGLKARRAIEILERMISANARARSTGSTNSRNLVFVAHAHRCWRCLKSLYMSFGGESGGRKREFEVHIVFVAHRKVMMMWRTNGPCPSSTF